MTALVAADQACAGTLCFAEKTKNIVCWLAILTGAPNSLLKETLCFADHNDLKS